MINRAALILRYKAPAVKWINNADPIQATDKITAEDINSERTVYLLREDVAETPDSLNKWIRMNLDILFETELEGWYTDERLWPQNRTYSLFKKWFDIECHTVIEDTVGEPIIDEEF